MHPLLVTSVNIPKMLGYALSTLRGSLYQTDLQRDMFFSHSTPTVPSKVPRVALYVTEANYISQQNMAGDPSNNPTTLGLSIMQFLRLWSTAESPNE